MGDLNNTAAVREHLRPVADPEYRFRSFAIPPSDDDPAVRERYRPFLLDEAISDSDWVAKLELATAAKLVETELLAQQKDRLRILVLYGSLRTRFDPHTAVQFPMQKLTRNAGYRSYSKLLAYEASRILFRLGCDVRVYDPSGLPVKDDQQHDHPKVQELRELSKWSDGHLWVSPEQHGTLTGVFKNQIDWIPLSTGSVRPTQGRTLAIAQVNGGSQSFNAVNSLRILGRWMRMFTIPNQSSIPKGWTHFTDLDDPVEGGSRLKPSSNRDRLVDCMEELVKYTIVMRPHFDLFGDRFSEREEKRDAEQASISAVTQVLKSM